jgi:hypothetical protein
MSSSPSESKNKPSQDTSVKQEANEACVLLGLFFDPEGEGDTFLRNVGSLSTDYTALYPTRCNSSHPLR